MSIIVSTTSLEEPPLPAEIAQWQQAVYCDPQNAEAHLHLGYAYAQHGDHTQAIISWNEARRLQPDNLTVLVNLGLLYTQLRYWQEAIETLEAALRLQSDLPDVHYSLGMAYAQLDRYGDAIKAWEDTLRLQPGRADAQANLRMMEERMAQINAAPPPQEPPREARSKPTAAKATSPRTPSQPPPIRNSQGTAEISQARLRLGHAALAAQGPPMDISQRWINFAKAGMLALGIFAAALLINKGCFTGSSQNRSRSVIYSASGEPLAATAPTLSPITGMGKNLVSKPATAPVGQPAVAPSPVRPEPRPVTLPPSEPKKPLAARPSAPSPTASKPKPTSPRSKNVSSPPASGFGSNAERILDNLP